MSDSRIGRRQACAALLGAGGGLLLAGPAEAQRRSQRRSTVAPAPAPSGQYYKDGKFQEQAAKEAYLALLRKAHYPISDTLEKNLFVTDFAIGRFPEVGLGTIIWITEKEANYTTLDIFLLPNQVLPEHWHVGLEKDRVGAKLESWLVRWGASYIVGEGEPTEAPFKIPEAEAKFLTVKHGKLARPGDTAGIRHALEKHWQLAGPEGAIISEVSTYHAGEAVRFTNPGIKF